MKHSRQHGVTDAQLHLKKLLQKIGVVFLDIMSSIKTSDCFCYTTVQKAIV